MLATEAMCYRNSLIANRLASVLSRTAGGRSQLRGKVMNQSFVRGGVNVNLLLRQAHRKIGGIGSKVAARGLRGSRDFLLGRFDNLPHILFRGGFDARLFGHGFF